MNSLAAYVEMLLRKHDCVVLPGFGALLCNYVPAHFSDDNGFIINPPSRNLAFNSLLSDSDGLLTSAISRSEGISYEAAVRRVNEQIEMMRGQLENFGELQFGNLGMFFSGSEKQIGFMPAKVPSINGAFYGLKPVEVMPVESQSVLNEQSAEIAEAVGERIGRRSVAWRAYATGIVASLAVIVTVALFFIPPIRVDRAMSTASIAPIPAETVNTVQLHEENTAILDVAAISDLISLAVGVKVTPDVVETDTVETIATEPVAQAIRKPLDTAVRFNESDPYLVIVASFPTVAQADSYVMAHRSRSLGILEKDGRFRIYAATAPTYAAANAQKALVGQNDAWVCRQ